VSASNAKVLLIEDSKFLRMANERALCKAGFEVGTAADGEEALQSIQDKPPDIILLDMLLPKISGPAVLKALKDNPTTMHIPVIVLTSLSQKNEEKLLQEGAAASFEKSALELDKSSDLPGGHGRNSAAPGQPPKGPGAPIERSSIQAIGGYRLADRRLEIETAGVESTACTTTIPPPPLKN
jgi:CheY-like chemotaxis protein